MKRNNTHAKDIANVLRQAKDVINLNQTYSNLMNEIEKILEYKIRWIIKKKNMKMHLKKFSNQLLFQTLLLLIFKNYNLKVVSYSERKKLY